MLQHLVNSLFLFFRRSFEFLDLLLQEWQTHSLERYASTLPLPPLSLPFVISSLEIDGIGFALFPIFL